MISNIFPQQPSILIIDDEPDNYDVIEGFLLSENYQLHYVSSAESAFNRCKKNLPDLILLDVMMPEMDGLEFCQRFKNNPEWSHIPIILVTALDREKTISNLSNGADDFIGKPFNKAELKARITSMLRIKFQYDALKQALNFRDDLTDMIIHDLVNPLSSILLQAELIKQCEISTNVSNRIHKIDLSAKQLYALTNDLLVYAKAEANKLVLQKQRFNAKVLMQDMVADFEELAAVRKISLRFICPEDQDFYIEGDRPLLMRVIMNLLANAIKFSQPNSEISLEINPERNSSDIFEFQIRDQGNGVSDDLKEKIFQKYAIGQRRENIAQTGLGLAFCKMVVESHQGQIYVTDNQPQGAVFSVQLPCVSPSSS